MRKIVMIIIVSFLYQQVGWTQTTENRTPGVQDGLRPRPVAEKMAPKVALRVSKIKLNGKLVSIEEARGKISGTKSKIRSLFNARVVGNVLELGFDERGLPHLYIKFPDWSEESVFCGLAGSNAFELRSNRMSSEVEELPDEIRREYHDDIIDICQSLIAFGLPTSLLLTEYTTNVFMPPYFFSISGGGLTLGDLATQPFFNSQKIISPAYRYEVTHISATEQVTTLSSILRPRAASEKLLKCKIYCIEFLFKVKSSAEGAVLI